MIVRARAWLDRYALIGIALSVVAGVLLRLSYVPANGYGQDVRLFRSWAEQVALVGPGRFYAETTFSDYPPAFLYVLGGFATQIHGEALRLAIKAVSVPADVGIALLVAAFLWSRGQRLAALGACAIWMFSPLPIFAGAYWGQIDSLGSLPALGALLAAGSRRWVLAGALAGLAVMIKPQFGLVGLVIGVAALIDLLRLRQWRPVALFSATAITAVFVIGFPFRFGPLELIALTREASDFYQYTSLFAFNIWAIVGGMLEPDAAYFVPSAFLLGVGLIASVVPLWWRRDTATLLTVAALTVFAFYFLPTRAHERYIVPAFVYLLPLIAVRPQLRLAYFALMAGVLTTLVVVFAFNGLLGFQPWALEFLLGRTVEIGLSLLLIGLTVYLVWLLLRHPKASRRSPGIPTLRELILWVLIAKLVGTILLFSNTTASAFDLPKSLWSQGLSLVLVGLLLLQASRRRLSIQIGPTALVVSSFIALAGVSTLFAPVLTTALFGESGRYLGLLFLLDMVVLFVALAVAVRSYSDWRLLALAAVATSIVVIGLALLQYVGLDPLGVARAGERPFSTFGNPNMLGQYLACVAAGALGLMMFGITNRTRVIAGAVLILTLGTITLVATRGSLLGLFGAVLILVVFLMTRRGATLNRVSLALGSAVLVAALIGLAISPLGSRVASVLIDSSTTERLEVWDTSLQLIADRPLLGFGPDSLAVGYVRHRDPGTEILHNGAVAVDQAHNWVLQTAATLGVPALILLGVLIWLIGRKLWFESQSDRAMIALPLLLIFAAYWTNALVTVEAVSVSWIPWAVGGLALALRADQPRWSFQFGLPRLVAIPVAVGLVALAASGVLAYRANEHIQRAALSFDAGDPRGTADEATQALLLDPLRGDYWNYRGVGREGRGLTALALRDFEEAIRLRPQQVNYWSNRARALSKLALAGDLTHGGAPAALQAGRDALAADPNNSSPHRVYSEIALALGQPELALAEAVEAIKLYPVGSDGPRAAALAAAQVTDRPYARSALNDALAHQNHELLQQAQRELEAR